jgi:large subunit ribosomal protein L14e
MVKRDFFVQVGRVCVINTGKYAGKYVTIMDIADSTRVLVDGPTSGVPRQLIPIKHLGLTKIRFRVPRTAKSSTLRKHLAVNKIDEKAKQNSWVKKAARQQTRENLTDFQRFQVQLLKKQRSLIIARK